MIKLINQKSISMDEGGIHNFLYFAFRLFLYAFFNDSIMAQLTQSLITTDNVPELIVVLGENIIGVNLNNVITIGIFDIAPWLVVSGVCLIFQWFTKSKKNNKKENYVDCILWLYVIALFFAITLCKVFFVEKTDLIDGFEAMKMCVELFTCLYFGDNVLNFFKDIKKQCKKAKNKKVKIIKKFIEICIWKAIEYDLTVLLLSYSRFYIKEKERPPPCRWSFSFVKQQKNTSF